MNNTNLKKDRNKGRLCSGVCVSSLSAFFLPLHLVYPIHLLPGVLCFGFWVGKQVFWSWCGFSLSPSGLEPGGGEFSFRYPKISHVKLSSRFLDILSKRNFNKNKLNTYKENRTKTQETLIFKGPWEKEHTAKSGREQASQWHGLGKTCERVWYHRSLSTSRQNDLSCVQCCWEAGKVRTKK